MVDRGRRPREGRQGNRRADLRRYWSRYRLSHRRDKAASRCGLNRAIAPNREGTMRFPILLAVVLLSAAPLRAETPPEESCNDANSTPEIVECLATQTAVWDRRLNTAYQKVMNSLPARRRDQLRSAQRLWIQFRDA